MTTKHTDLRDNETAFVQDCIAFNEGRTVVNPYVGCNTCYGIHASKVKDLLTQNGVFHSTYNPRPATALATAGLVS